MHHIKKYSNRRLYDTHTSSYLNLSGLVNLIQAGEEIEIISVQTGEDITREVLLQALMEVDGGKEVFPLTFLKRIIRMRRTGPWQQFFLKQVAAAMELLDAKLANMEEQLPPEETFDLPIYPQEEIPLAPEPETLQPPPKNEKMDQLQLRLEKLKARLQK